MPNVFEGDWDSKRNNVPDHNYNLSLSGTDLIIEYPQGSGKHFPVQFNSTTNPPRISFSVRDGGAFCIYTGELIAERDPRQSGCRIFGFTRGRFVVFNLTESAKGTDPEISDSGDWTSTRPPIT